MMGESMFTAARPYPGWKIALIVVLGAGFPTRLPAVPYQPITVHDVDLLPSGNLLVTDGGGFAVPGTSGVYEIDRSGNILWSYTTGLNWAHNADQQADGSVILSDTNNDRVLIVSAGGTVIWNSDSVPLSDGSALSYPNDANLLAGGNRLITDRDNHRVIEVTIDGTIVWQFGQTGVPGGGASRLNGPHNADRLDNGNTIIADSNNRRIIEVTPAGNIVWIFGLGLNWPRDADRLTGGNTLINDSNNRRIIEVTSAGAIVWSVTVTDLSYDSDRLAGGNTLLSEGSSMKEVDSSGTVVWSYPSVTAPEVVWITNPTSGVDLYGHVHRPANFNPVDVYPGIILCPSGSGTGTSFDNGNTAQSYADLGFIVMHFDPDGRGQSTNGGTYTTEDYCGYLQQDGAHVVLQYLVDLPETDNRHIGVVTSSYGITLGAGVVGRYPNNPPVKFVLDWEGPADRTDTAQPNGHVPHSTLDDDWWYEREPTNFIDDFAGYYLRVQTQIDHVQADNEHAIKLLNRATNTIHGGFGLCLWTRCNSPSGVTNNLPNAVYSYPTNQPQYLAESVNLNQIQQQYLVELAGMPPLQTDGDFDDDGDVDLADFAPFEICFTGPGGAFAPGCEPGDFDGDADIDCSDWAQFVLAWTDPGQPPELAQCASQSIPAVSQWGSASMILLLLTTATLVLRRTASVGTRRSIGFRGAWEGRGGMTFRSTMAVVAVTISPFFQAP